MKKIFCMILIGIAAVSFVACGGDKKESADVDSKPSIEDNNDKDNKDEDGKEESEKADDESADTKPNEENKPEVKPETKPEVKPENKPENKPEVKPETKPEVKPEVKPDDKTERIFKIATKDSNYKVVSGGEVKTVGLGVAENINKILDTVSSKYFNDKNIELKTIEAVKNKKIAVINLTGDETAWNQNMQGSVGGQITEYTLIENVLQRQYTGYWIDGVRFTLNGKEIQTDHAPGLGKTTYR